MTDIPNPLESNLSLKRPLDDPQLEPQPIFQEDSAVSKAEKAEINGVNTISGDTKDGSEVIEPSSKRLRLQDEPLDGISESEPRQTDSRDKIRGIAMIKEE